MLIYLIFSLIILCNYPAVSSKPGILTLSSVDHDPIVVSLSGDSHKARLISLDDGTFAIAHDEKLAFLYNDVKEEVSSEYVLNAANDFFINKMENSFEFQGVPQWKLYVFEDFQKPLQGWSKDSVSVCGSNNNLFLGGHCNFAGDFVYKSFGNLPKHKKIMVKFNFHFIDQWEGEEAFAQIDKVLIWKESYSWCDKVLPWYCKKYGINACGNDYPDRLSHPVMFVGKHDSESFTLTFATTLTKNSCVASWGVDDLQIYLA